MPSARHAETVGKSLCCFVSAFDGAMHAGCLKTLRRQMRRRLPAWQIFAPSTSHGAAYDDVMNNVIISISWEYLLGLFGTLIGIAYYANGRFTRLETSVEWLTDTFRGLKIASENGSAKLFGVGSPVSLTRSGEQVLRLSGLKSYIDAHKERLAALCRQDPPSDRYEDQTSAFRVFADLQFERHFEHQLNEFAFANGMSPDLLRRVGAIYLRDLISQEINH